MIRPYRAQDAPALLALFRETVHRVNARDYAPEQLRAWAAPDLDEAAWAARFEGHFAVVAERDGRRLGFADLAPDGLVDRLFVSADHQGEGIGRRLLEALVDHARATGLHRLTTRASKTARPFFERAGFRVIAAESAVVRGVALANFAMERRLGDDACST